MCSSRPARFCPDLQREVVSVAISYLDRYLAKRTVDRRTFQAAAVTALHLALKLCEPRNLPLSALLHFSRGYFEAKHIAAMEGGMLHALGWHVHPPTPLAFCQDFLRLASEEMTPRVRHAVADLARFMTELTVCDYWFVTKRASSIALAAIANVLKLQGSGRVDPMPQIELLCRVTGVDVPDDGEILACYRRLRTMYMAGGYSHNLERAAEEEGSPVVIMGSPVGVMDGPDMEELNVDANMPSAAACAVSPEAVIPESSSGPRKRKARSFTRHIRAKRGRKNLSRELEEE